MLPQKTARLEDYTACVGPYCEPWRTALGVLLIAGIYAGGGYLLGIFFIYLAESVQIGSGYVLVFEMALGSTPRAVLISLFFIALILPGLWLVLKFLHHRSILSLIAPTGKVHWKHFRRAAVFVVVFSLLTSIPVFYYNEYTQQLSFAEWLPWIAPALILLFLQTTTEELVFRGYLMQQLAARFHNRWIWWVLPAVIFGAIHYSPLHGENSWLVVGATILTGLILGDITARFGDLSIAMGIHFANNLVVIFLLGVPGQISGLSLFLHDFNIQDTDAMRIGILSSTGLMLAIYFVYLLVMRGRR